MGLPSPPGTRLGCGAWEGKRACAASTDPLCVSTVPPCEASRPTHLPPAHNGAVFPPGGTLFLQSVGGGTGGGLAPRQRCRVPELPRLTGSPEPPSLLLRTSHVPGPVAQGQSLFPPGIDVGWGWGVVTDRKTPLSSSGVLSTRRSISQGGLNRVAGRVTG